MQFGVPTASSGNSRGLPLVKPQSLRRSTPSPLQHSRSRHCCASSTGGPSSVPALSDMKLSIPNIRDLSEAVPAIKSGRIWRCARPSNASETDVCTLLDKHGIKDLIDLRSSEELSEDRYYDPYDGSFSEMRHTLNPVADDAAREPRAQATLSEGADSSTAGASSSGLDGESKEAMQWTSRRVRTLLGGTQFRQYIRRWMSRTMYPEQRGPTNASVVHHQVSLLERNRYYRALLSHVPAKSLAKASILGLMRYKEDSRLVLLREVNAGGLVLLYKILIDSAKPEIRTVLELILNSLQSDRPVLFFCKAGKDRTGIIAALVLKCAGASDLQVVNDYARSDAFHAVALAGIENKPELAGLDRSAFERAPAEAMRETIKYLNSKYGSMSGYMTHVGFGPESQHTLGRLLTKEG